MTLAALQSLQKQEVKALIVPGTDAKVYVKLLTQGELFAATAYCREGIKKEPESWTEQQTRNALFAVALVNEDGSPLFDSVDDAMEEVNKIPLRALTHLISQNEEFNKPVQLPDENEAVDLAKKSGVARGKGSSAGSGGLASVNANTGKGSRKGTT